MSPTAILEQRPATAADEAFLYRLFASVRGAEFAALGEAMRELVLRSQFQSQLQGYRSRFPASHQVVVLQDGKPVGRLWTHQDAQEHRIIDISLLPEFQNRGIGTRLLQQQMQAAAKAAVPLRVSVFRANIGSLRLHTRLGFSVAQQDAMYLHLEWRPAGSV